MELFQSQEETAKKPYAISEPRSRNNEKKLDRATFRARLSILRFLLLTYGNNRRQQKHDQEI